MKEILLQSRSRKNIGKAAESAVKEPSGFAELISLMKGKDDYLGSLAAWAMSIAVEKDKKLIVPYHKDLVRIAKQTTHPAIKRNIVRAWSFIEIPLKFAYEIADICFGYLSSPKEAIAVKAFSLTVLQHLVKLIPEMDEEVRFEIEKQLPHSSAAFKVRANAYLKVRVT